MYHPIENRSPFPDREFDAGFPTGRPLVGLVLRRAVAAGERLERDDLAEHP